MDLNNIDYEKLKKYEAIDLEHFLDENDFSQSQRLEIYKKITRERKTKVTNYVKKEGVKSIKEGVTYVHAFTQNLLKLEDNFSGSEFKILFYFCNLMQHGNILLINFNQTVLAKDLNMSQANVSKCLTKLKAKDVLIEKNGHTFINSNLFLKGQYHSLNKDRRAYVKEAQGENTMYDSVYNFDKVSSKNEDREKPKSKKVKKLKPAEKFKIEEKPEDLLFFNDEKNGEEVPF